MIRRIRVRGYKSLRDVEAAFSPLTVVFGPNAAGKSNLMDALALMSHVATRSNLEAAFTDHRGFPLEAFTLPEGGLEELQAKSTARFTLEADVDVSDAVVASIEDQIRRAREGLPRSEASSRPSVRERSLRYRVTIEIVTDSGFLRVVDERLSALRSDGKEKGSRKPFLEKVGGNRIHLRMEKQGHPTYEDLGQDRTLVSKSLYAPHYPHISAFREELARWRFYFLEPSAMRAEAPLKEVDDLARNGSDIAAFYNTLRSRRPRQFESLSKALERVILGVNEIDVERTKEGQLRLLVNESGLKMSSRLVSEGTLRVLGLLAITNPIEPLSVVGYEEPENGVHPRRLSLVAKILMDAADRGPTQFIINTHSPVLPEYFLDLPNAQLVQCRKEGRDTLFEPFSSGPLLQAMEIEKALEEPPSSFAERIVRGDYGG